MSRKHFEAMAAEIRSMYVAAVPLGNGMYQHADLKYRAQGAEDVCVSVSMQFNPNFDSVRFRAACRP